MNTYYDQQQAYEMRDRLLGECHILLEKISRQPYFLKRLITAKAALEAVVNYKSKRRHTVAG